MLDDISKIAQNYHNWQQDNYEDSYSNIPEYCHSAKLEDVARNDFSLVPSKYIEFIDRDLELDFDKEMKRIQGEFKKLLKDEKKSQEELIEAFKGLGYEL